MTVDEFKKAKPELAHLEGDMLLNAMEDYFLTLQNGQEVMKTAMPFFKRYQLRYLFYRRLQNMRFQKADWSSPKRCTKCHSPIGLTYGFIYSAEDGNRSFITYCPKCNQELKEETNKNISHRVWRIYNYLSGAFWAAMRYIHLIKSDVHGRYDMFGDERKYVKHWIVNYETGKSSYVLNSRKWWEYIFVERSQFKF